jgi:hypothetical protein
MEDFLRIVLRAAGCNMLGGANREIGVPGKSKFCPD